MLAARHMIEMVMIRYVLLVSPSMESQSQIPIGGTACCLRH